MHIEKSVVIAVCGVKRKDNMGSLMNGTPIGPKTDGDRLIKDNLGRYCQKTIETVGVVAQWQNTGGLNQRPFFQ